MQTGKICLAFLSIFAFGSLFLCNSPANAATYFYVDPDFSGISKGSESNPWTSINWNTVNAALVNDDVTVFYSAREAGSDTDEITGRGITFGRSQDSSNQRPSKVLNRLTLDGMSKYNTNDSAPSWADYSGDSHFHITANNPGYFGGNVNFQHYITIKGFVFESTEYQPLNWFGGDHVIIEDNHMYHMAGEPVSAGPGFKIQYVSDEGCNANSVCVPSQSGGCQQNCGVIDFTFQRNKVGPTYGEGVYIGGWSDTEIYGNPAYAHSGVNILNNVIFDAGLYGAQGDLLDIKPGHSNMIIRGNELFFTNPAQGGASDGLVTMSVGLIENNYIHDINDRCIGFGVFWGKNEDAKRRRGGIVRNNILVNCGAINEQRDYGISLESNGTFGNDYFEDMKIYNNTIFKANAAGINIENKSANIMVKNNIVSNTSGLSDSGIGTILSHNYVGSSPGFDDPSPPYFPAGFRINPNSINTFDQGTPIKGISSDFFGTLRPQGLAWDIGAVEWGNPPNPPTNLKVVP